MTTFIHTADWQLGKPFAGIEDLQKRSLLQNERFSAIRRIGSVAHQHQARFVIVAGDLFDSPMATKSTVSVACSAIGSIKVPVYVIPGNHDHGGEGCLWSQEFFQRERNQLAPNLHVLLKPEPVEIDDAVLFPCPLLRRHELTDPTAWLQSIADKLAPDQLGNRPRIVIAHGSITDFGSFNDDEEIDGGAANLIDLQRIPERYFDFIALGDWHGTKQVGPTAWYAGTPEADRFAKGSDHYPGHVLVVDAYRGEAPTVQRVHTAAIGWHEFSFAFTADSGLDRLQEIISQRIGQRSNMDLMKLQLDGFLGITASSQLNQMIESWVARLIRVKLSNQTKLVPTAEELDGLMRRSGDPLVSRVAARLVAMSAEPGENAAVAGMALRELYSACKSC